MADDTTRLRLLLAEDHVLVRDGLKRLINDQPDMEVIAEAEDGVRAVRLAQHVMPDVALVDVSMPGLGHSNDHGLVSARKSDRLDEARRR